MLDLEQLLRTLPNELAAQVLHGATEDRICHITCDSRKAGPESIFVAIKGSRVDGHDFLAQVAEQGCSCAVVEDDPGPLNSTTVVRVKDSHAALGWLAAALHDFPAKDMTLIGLTGTNGKTTISWLIEQMLTASGCQVGVIGTVNYRWTDRAGRVIAEKAPLTTPGPVQLQNLLRAMADAGVTHVVMETSSHALEQRRLAGLRFDVGLFTNLTRDHLDFHGTMEAYFAAKKLLFSRYLKENGKAVIVTEQDWGQQLCQKLATERPDLSQCTCGLAAANSISVADLQQDIRGFSCNLSLQGKVLPFRSCLTGRHNVLNILAAAGAGLALTLPLEQIVFGLAQERQVPGRLERVRLPGLAEEEQPVVLIDYAHSPDALENVLQTLRPLTEGRLFCVFGCGGDRDKGKRPQMAAAAQYADVTIVTSDNPRSEDPETIISEIAAGCRAAGLAEIAPDELASAKGFVCISDRRTAIHTACALAGPQDIVLIAGKGHEDYQIIGAERHFFDDRLEAVNGLLRWTARHLQKATGGTVAGQAQGPAPRFGGDISTDTRTLKKGDVFVALAGEKFDGHDYVEKAIAAGAAAMIVQREVEVSDETLVIHVADTLQALLDLAAYRRRLLGKRLIVAAITGSSGKTSVKELVAAIFSHHFAETKTGIEPVLKTQGNFNNLVGMPLSLLPIAAKHKAAVLEMGMNHPGEIARLVAAAQPDIACITNVQAAHLEGLGSIEGVAKAKGELFAGLRADAVSVINLDDSQVCKLPTTSEQVIGFAVTPDGLSRKPEVSAVSIANFGEQGMRFTLRIHDWQQELALALPGLHSVSNCCAAAAVAHAAGIAPETIANALRTYQSRADKRMQVVSLSDGIKVLNDCYNANPGSMSAALKTLRGFGTDCQHIALLGDMLELGESSKAAHEKIGSEAAQLGYDQVAATGTFAEQVAAGARLGGLPDKMIHVFPDTEAMAAWLLKEIDMNHITAGDWLLLKGSRGMRMEKVLERVQARLDKEDC